MSHTPSPKKRPYTLILLPSGKEVSTHTSLVQARKTGREYCDTDKETRKVRQYVRIEGPNGFAEHWRLVSTPFIDGHGNSLKFIEGL